MRSILLERASKYHNRRLTLVVGGGKLSAATGEDVGQAGERW